MHTHVEAVALRESQVANVTLVHTHLEAVALRESQVANVTLVHTHTHLEAVALRELQVTNVTLVHIHTLRLLLCVNRRLQMSHSYGFSPVWTRRCRFNLYVSGLAYGQ